MFFERKTKQFIGTGSFGTNTMDCRKLFSKGDLLITTDIIGRCSESIMQDKFACRANALILMNDFLRWGDAEAYVAVNEDDTISGIYQEIVSFQGQTTSLERGKLIYPKIQ